jgi:hypothetical protein
MYNSDDSQHDPFFILLKFSFNCKAVYIDKLVRIVKKVTNTLKI